MSSMEVDANPGALEVYHSLVCEIALMVTEAELPSGGFKGGAGGVICN